MSTNQTDPTATVAWWRLPIVWMVIAGPLIVVVASFVTLGLAIKHPDPVLTTSAAADRSEQPAVQARNHAATPGR
jgi:uncharacterized protein